MTRRPLWMQVLVCGLGIGLAFGFVSALSDAITSSYRVPDQLPGYLPDPSRRAEIALWTMAFSVGSYTLLLAVIAAGTFVLTFGRHRADPIRVLPYLVPMIVALNTLNLVYPEGLAARRVEVGFVTLVTLGAVACAAHRMRHGRLLKILAPWLVAGGTAALALKAMADTASPLRLPMGVTSLSVALLLAIALRRVASRRAWVARVLITAGAGLVAGSVAVASVALALRPDDTVPWPDKRQRPVPAGASRNLVLITIDTLRADHLSSYGYPAATSPNIDALAAGGARFTTVYTPTPWTRPATAALLTGRTPYHHGTTLVTSVLPDTVSTLAEVLHAEAFRTMGISANPNVTRSFGFGQGFDHFDDKVVEAHAFGSFVESLDLPARLARRFFDLRWDWLEHNHAGMLNEEILPWITQCAQRRERFFLYVHYIDPHEPYGPPNRDDAPLIESASDVLRGYAEEVAFVDARVGEVVAALKRQGVYDETLIVVTSDHGEEFEEHGHIGHGYNFYDPTLRVPLVVRVPGKGTAGAVIDEPVGLIDVMPTLLALLGVRADHLDMDGRNLAPLLDGGSMRLTERPLLLHTDTERYRGRGVVRDGWKYVQSSPAVDQSTSDEALFDLGADRAERTNLVATRPEVVAGLRRIVADASAGATLEAETVEITPERRRQLEALGYLAGE